MNSRRLLLFVVFCFFACISTAQSVPAKNLANSGQREALSTHAAQVPHVVKFSGILQDAKNNPLTNSVSILFAVYRESDSGAPLWQETQNVIPDSAGKYTVLLGATKPDGISQDVFSSGEARWLGVQVEGQTEQARVALVSVPYALKAADAETLGGKPVSAFVLSEPAKSTAQRLQASSQAPPPTTSSNLPISTGATDGTINVIPKFSGPSTLINSAMIEDSNGFIGIGNSTPQGRLGLETNVFYGALVMGQNDTSQSAHLRHLVMGYDTTLNFGGIAAVEEGIAYRPLVLNPDGGTVGVGTRTPAATFDVNGTIRAGNGVIFPDGTTQATSAASVASLSLTGQTAAITNQPVYTSASGGLFQVTVYAVVTTTGTSGSYQPSVSWTDVAKAQTGFLNPFAVSGLGIFSSAVGIVQLAAGQSITLSVQSISAVGGTYAVFVKVTKL